MKIFENISKILKIPKISKIPIIPEILQKSCKNHHFVIFTEFPKSRIPIRNRRLGGLLMSKFNKKNTIGKLRFRAFHRLKNQRLRTSPSKVMTLSKSDKKSIKFMKNHKILKISSFCLPEVKKTFF